MRRGITWTAIAVLAAALVSGVVVFGQRVWLERKILAQAAATTVGSCGLSPLPTAGEIGLSGLAGASATSVWALAESGALLRYQVDDQMWCLAEVLSNVKSVVDTELDLESLAVLSGDRLVFGSENAGIDRDHDTLFVIEVVGKTLSSLGHFEFAYSAWPNIDHSANHGIEGLCQANGWLVAASERIAEQGAHRLAPLGFYHEKTKTWLYASLALHSPSGRVSALECRPSGEDELEVWAIERNFGVAWLHHFKASPATLRASRGVPLFRDPEPVDLRRCWTNEATNFEAIWVRGEQTWLINDNYFGHVTTPTEVKEMTSCLGRNPVGAPSNP